MANRLYNQQISPKGYKRGGGVTGKTATTKTTTTTKSEKKPGFFKTAGKQAIGTSKKIGKKFRTKKMGGGIMMKRPMMKKGGLAKLNPGLKAFMKKKMAKKK